VKVKINPFDSGNPMSVKDAAEVALVGALAIWILTFLVDASIGQLRADPEEFLFEAVKAYVIAWAGNFISLAGLSELVKKATAESVEPG